MMLNAIVRKRLSKLNKLVLLIVPLFFNLLNVIDWFYVKCESKACGKSMRKIFFVLLALVPRMLIVTQIFIFMLNVFLMKLY